MELLFIRSEALRRHCVRKRSAAQGAAPLHPCQCGRSPWAQGALPPLPSDVTGGLAPVALLTANGIAEGKVKTTWRKGAGAWIGEDPIQAV